MYSSRAFIWVVTLLGFVWQIKVWNCAVFSQIPFGSERVKKVYMSVYTVDANESTADQKHKPRFALLPENSWNHRNFFQENKNNFSSYSCKTPEILQTVHSWSKLGWPKIIMYSVWQDWNQIVWGISQTSLNTEQVVVGGFAWQPCWMAEAVNISCMKRDFISQRRESVASIPSQGHKP